MQLDLVLPMPAARASDPRTSHEAAARMRKAASEQAAKVLYALTQLGEGGAEQIGHLCGLLPHAVRRRLPELQEAGYVEPTGETRRTLGGRSERIWRRCA